MEDQRGTSPIILGDFNIYKLAKYKEQNQLLNNYTLSSDVHEYISYPADGESLDYIAVPKSIYEIKDVECPDLYVSDHKYLSAKITFLTPVRIRTSHR